MNTFTPMSTFDYELNIHVFGLWENAGVAGGNPEADTERSCKCQNSVLDLTDALVLNIYKNLKSQVSAYSGI